MFSSSSILSALSIDIQMQLNNEAIKHPITNTTIIVPTIIFTPIVLTVFS